MEAGHSELKRLRSACGDTQETAARKIGVTPRTWRRWESGEDVPLPKYRRALADQLGLTLSELDDVLHAPARDYGEGGTRRRRARSPLVEHIEASLPLLQKLDDVHGGGTHLDYVSSQADALAALLRTGAHATTERARLMKALVEIKQLAGWMAVDAEREGDARRHFSSGLSAAREVNYRSMSAHILADMSYQAACAGNGAGAVAMGESALRQAQLSSGSVQASVASRLAYAYAVAGDPRRCIVLHKQALDLLADSHDDPPWLYFFSSTHIDCQTGYALILSGRRAKKDHDRSGTALIARGEALLRGGAHDQPGHDPSQRRALFEGAWLTLSYSAQSRWDDVRTEGRRAVRRLATVHSPRSERLLRTLAADLRPRTRHAAVDDFLPELDHALKRRDSGETPRLASPA